MLHPVAVTPAMFLTTDSIVVVRFDQKQRFSNAFYYVVLRLRLHPAHRTSLSQQADAIAKLQNLLGI